jgi:drug/metabolite transporter (DMT)-like permease
VLGVVLLGEEPTGLQVAGAVLVLIGLLTATSRSRVSARAPVRESA